MDLMLLQGGLGNQLFQWAFSLNQKTTGKRDLKYSTLLLDLKLPQITKREYCLKDLIPAEKFESKLKSGLKLMQSKTGNKFQIMRELNKTNSQIESEKITYSNYKDPNFRLGLKLYLDYNDTIEKQQLLKEFFSSS